MGCRISRARKLFPLGVLIVFSSAPSANQEPTSTQTGQQFFEVASVRPNKSAPSPFATVETQPNGSVTAENISVGRLITWAYGIDVNQIVEGPAAALNRNYDVIAKASSSVERPAFPAIGPLNVMMQNLLADRFKLRVHWEERPQAGYALVRVKPDGPLGPRLRATDIKCRRGGALGGQTDDKSGLKAPICFVRSSGNEMNASGITMADIARFFTAAFQRPVVDKTELVGSFDVSLFFDAGDLKVGARPNGPDGAPNAPSLFSAVQEQWGLRLEQQRVPVRILVVDHIEPPSEN